METFTLKYRKLNYQKKIAENSTCKLTILKTPNKKKIVNMNLKMMMKVVFQTVKKKTSNLKKKMTN